MWDTAGQAASFVSVLFFPFQGWYEFFFPYGSLYQLPFSEVWLCIGHWQASLQLQLLAELWAEIKGDPQMSNHLVWIVVLGMAASFRKTSNIASEDVFWSWFLVWFSPATQLSLHYRRLQLQDKARENKCNSSSVDMNALVLCKISNILKQALFIPVR